LGFLNALRSARHSAPDTIGVAPVALRAQHDFIEAKIAVKAKNCRRTLQWRTGIGFGRSGTLKQPHGDPVVTD